jgi:hypothetical protein
MAAAGTGAAAVAADAGIDLILDFLRVNEGCDERPFFYFCHR